MTITTDFYNKLKEDIGKTYFPTVKYYRDNANFTKAAYAIELFNNGCLKYHTLVKRLQKQCKADRVAIESMVNKYVSIPLNERIIALVMERGETGYYKAYEFGELYLKLGVTVSQLRSALSKLERKNIITRALPGLGGGRKCTYYLHKSLEVPN